MTPQNNAIIFPTKNKLYKSHVMSMLLYTCESWTLMAVWRGESRPLATNATGECLAYQTESTKQANMYDSMLISSPDVRSFHCQHSSMTSCRGSAMSVVIICCQRSYYKEPWTAVGGVAGEGPVNQGRTTSMSGQARRCRCCCASGMTVANCPVTD